MMPLCLVELISVLHKSLSNNCTALADISLCVQTIEQGIKPGKKAAKDALKQAKDSIPEPEDARKQARDYTEGAATSAAKTVKDNARPTADKVEKEVIRPAQEAAEALPGQVKVCPSIRHQSLPPAKCYSWC